MAKKRKQEEAAMGYDDSGTDEGEFESPPSDAEDDSDSSSEFVAPEGVDDGGGAAMESSGGAQSVKDVIALIQERLASEAGMGVVSVARAENHEEHPHVLGVGLSSGDDEAGGAPGEAALVVFVENQCDQEEVRREVVDTMGAHALSHDEFPVQIEVTGPIEAHSSNRSKFRPAPGGVSIGHPLVTAGTLGGFARGNGSRSNRLLLVSNNHVIAASNKGKYGDSVLQPGRADGGVNTRDRIAILERFVPISFKSGAVNYVDCGTGWCWPNLVRRDRHVYHAGSKPVLFRVGACMVEPHTNMIVGKTGRTTNLTKGLITATNVSINVNFGAAGVAHFRDQFAVRSVTSNPFSAGGDSGSFVWRWDSRRCVVGLLFAGGGGTTFCNRISRVVKALDIGLL